MANVQTEVPAQLSLPPVTLCKNEDCPAPRGIAVTDDGYCELCSC